MKKKKKKRAVSHATSLIIYLLILMMRLHVDEIYIQEKKRTSQKSHCTLTVYFPKIPLLSSGFQKRLSRNEKQEIKFSGQHTRSTNEQILQ